MEEVGREGEGGARVWECSRVVGRTVGAKEDTGHVGGGRAVCIQGGQVRSGRVGSGQPGRVEEREEIRGDPGRTGQIGREAEVRSQNVR